MTSPQSRQCPVPDTPDLQSAQRLHRAGGARARERLDPLIARKCPLDVPIKKPKATWVQPVVDAEIEYSGLTDDGLLRAAVFKGVRDDLAPAPPSAPGAHGCPDASHIAEATMTLADLGRLAAADGAARLRPLQAPGASSDRAMPAPPGAGR